MTQTTKRDAARLELLRLLKGLEFYRAWRIAGIQAATGDVRQDDLNAIVEPGTAFLEYFDSAGGQYGQILQTVQDWYSHTFSELCDLMNAGSAPVSSDIRQFLTDFRSEVGFDFQSEAGLVGKTIKRVLENGKITKKSEYFILKELENDVDQSLLKGRDYDAIASILRQFENR